MQYSDNIIPIGGLNLDDDPRHLEPTDYVYCRNAHIATGQAQGDHGLLQSLRSTLEVEFPSLGSDSWTQITHLGAVLDEENDFAFLLSQITDTTAGDRFVITKHNIIDNTMKTIMDVDAASWNIIYRNDINWRFFNPQIVDNKLVWTDNENNIRMTDVGRLEATIDAGIDRTVIYWDSSYSDGVGYAVGTLVWYLSTVYRVIQNTQYSGVTPPDYLYFTVLSDVESVYLDPIDPNNFTLAALPPLIAPTTAYNPDPNTKINNMRGQTWQFSYRYIYMDYRRSTYAPPSKVPPPSQEETIDGEQNPDTTHNNSIRVTINTGSEEVRSIQIIARSSEDPATWFLIKEIYVFTDLSTRVLAANRSITHTFNNDAAKTAVNVTEVYTPFSYVPIKAKHMELVEGNRLVFANISEGYGRIGSLVTTTLSWEDLASITEFEIPLNLSGIADFTDPIKWTWLLRFTLTSENPGAVEYRIGIAQNLTDPLTWVSYDYDGLGAYPSSVVTGLQNAINAEWPGAVEVCNHQQNPAPTQYQFCAFEVLMPNYDQTPAYINWQYQFMMVRSLALSTDKYTNLKTGATHSWGIIYRDLVGRLSPVIGAGDIQMYIPFPTEDAAITIAKRPLVTFKINHLPPSWAESYEIVYAGNKSISWWLHLIGYNFGVGKMDHDDPESTGNQLDNTFRMRVGAAQAQTRDVLQNWSVEDYSWEKGDRMRIFGKVTGTGDVTEIVDYIYDVEVTGVFTDTDYYKTIDEASSTPDDETIQEWVYFKKDPLNPLTPGKTGWFLEDTLFVEIYRPLLTESGLYFTTGMTFKIGTNVYGDKYHQGDVYQVLSASGDPSVPCQVYNTSHDSWKYIRNFRNIPGEATLRIWGESQFASDYYITKQLDSRGNPIPDVDSQQQNILNKRMRHGGAISIGSQLNYLADFQYDDFLDLDDNNGPIEGIRLVGFVLKAVQYTKVTAVYIARQESFSASGSPEYLFTDKVFGSARPAMEDWGSSHPSSIMVHNRHLYFWDQSEGLVIRDAANGQEPISGYKMRQHFKDLARTMDAISKESQSVFFAYSEETDELLCMFGHLIGEKNMWRFSERDNRWKGHINPNFVRNVIYWMGHRLYSTYNRNLYQWWSGVDYGNITGTQREGLFDFYSRAEPLKVKTFDAISTYMTGSAPDYTEAQIIEDKATAGASEMETSMYAVNTEQREGLYYTQILRDKNTPGPGTEDEKLIGGRRMRGLYMKFRLKLTGTILKTVSNIRVFSTPSERSG